MILDVKSITTAYRCSECGETVYGITGAVALTGDMIKLKCPCGGSAMTIKNIADGKVRVTVPCAFCQSDHTFVISKKLLLSKELFTYPCPYTAIDICFFGTDEKVKEAVRLSDEVLDQYFVDENGNRLSDLGKPHELSDEHVRDLITLVLGELADDGKIFCDCGVSHDLAVRDGNDYVELRCKKCGCSKRYYCDSSLGTEELFNADEVHLFKEE
ncbi:MAG: hypothetical protein IKP68_03640 [Clostridia bacterium]|nr:hypothetical protein [Clostridia bacterium]